MILKINIININDILSSTFLLSIVFKAFIVGCFVSLMSSLLGLPLVLKRYSMIGDGLSHVGFGAMAIATAAGFSTNFALEFSIPIVIISSFFLLKLSDNKKFRGDSAIAIFSTVSIALGIIIYNYSTGMTSDVCASMFGSSSVLIISNKDFILSVILSIILLFIYICSYNNFFAISFDENYFNATGKNIKLYKFLISIMTAITIVLGMKMMGAILVSGLIVFPAITAIHLCKSYKSAVQTSGILGVICFIIGFFIACIFDLQIGPAVILTNLLITSLCLLIKHIINKRSISSVQNSLS